MFRDSGVLDTISRTTASLIEDLGPSLVVMIATLAFGAWALGVEFDTEALITTHP